MPTYKLTIEYNGAGFSGWQAQENLVTVQGRLIDALRIALRQDVAIQGASRTDAGVHALGQVASICLPEEIDPRRLSRSLSSLCRPEISVPLVERVADGFNARFAAAGKHYRYMILNRSAHAPLQLGTCWHVGAPLQVDKMRKSAAEMLGTHDFCAFRASDCQRDNTIRTVTDIQIVQNGSLLEIHVWGTAFLKYMVRIMVGTLVDVGKGTLPEDIVPKLFESKNRSQGGRTAPACGLTLMEVFYDENTLKLKSPDA